MAGDQSGSGKTFERICGNCHEPVVVTAQRHTRQDWKGIIEDMVSRGAEGTPEEIGVVIDYLTRNFGKIRINVLDAAGLAKEMELTPEEAAAIEQYRSKNGPFKDFDSLKKAVGVPVAKLEAYKSSMVF